VASTLWAFALPLARLLQPVTRARRLVEGYVRGLLSTLEVDKVRAGTF
jgi:hypothetical protein